MYIYIYIPFNVVKKNRVLEFYDEISATGREDI